MNVISTGKKENPKVSALENNKHDKEEITKNIMSEFDKGYDVKKVIFIQSKYRQKVAKQKFKELKQRSYVSAQQKSLSSNKKKVLALRVISNTWLLYREARTASVK
jgi:hypothetical protein